MTAGRYRILLAGARAGGHDGDAGYDDLGAAFDAALAMADALAASTPAAAGATRDVVGERFDVRIVDADGALQIGISGRIGMPFGS